MPPKKTPAKKLAELMKQYEQEEANRNLAQAARIQRKIAATRARQLQDEEMRARTLSTIRQTAGRAATAAGQAASTARDVAGRAAGALGQAASTARDVAGETAGIFREAIGEMASDTATLGRRAGTAIRRNAGLLYERAKAEYRLRAERAEAQRVRDRLIAEERARIEGHVAPLHFGPGGPRTELVQGLLLQREREEIAERQRIARQQILYDDRRELARQEAFREERMRAQGDAHRQHRQEVALDRAYFAERQRTEQMLEQHRRAAAAAHEARIDERRNALRERAQALLNASRTGGLPADIAEEEEDGEEEVQLPPGAGIPLVAQPPAIAQAPVVAPAAAAPPAGLVEDHAHARDRVAAEAVVEAAPNPPLNLVDMPMDEYEQYLRRLEQQVAAEQAPGGGGASA